MTAPTVATDELTRLSVSVEIRYRADVDVPGLIRKYLAEYKALDMKGCEPWERPAVFVTEAVAELLDIGFGPDDGAHIEDRSYNEDPEIDFRWTRAHWDALLAVFPEADPDFVPDPWAAARVPGPLDVPLPIDLDGGDTA